MELPFTLTHPKPEPDIETSKEADTKKAASVSVTPKKETPATTNGNDQTVPVDLNLIEFDTK